MTRFLMTILMGSLVLACSQKVEKQQAANNQSTSADNTKQAPPRPAIRQSDGRVWVDGFTTEKGASGAFKVNYYGVEEAKAFVIPLTFPKGMLIDSVSFVGSMLSYIATRPVRIDNENRIVLMTAIPTTEANIPAKEGVLATVYYKLTNDAESGSIEETFVPPGNYLTYVDTSSVLIEPHFEAGQVTVH